MIGALKRAKEKTIDVVSDVMSHKPRKDAEYAEYKANKAVKDIRENRRFKQMDEAGVADKGDESDPLFRYRANQAIKPSPAPAVMKAGRRVIKF